MHRIALCLALTALAACHGFFGGRTTEEDLALNSFAESRQRAATYYDGGDYDRAAVQYEKALEFKPKHLPTQMGLAYSLLKTDSPRNLIRAKNEFDAMGHQRKDKEEVKRVFGLAMTYRSLATHYARRAVGRDRRGKMRQAAEDFASTRQYAREGIVYFKKVMDFDVAMAKKQGSAPTRMTASLTPDAHVGIAHCEILLIEREVGNETELTGHLETAESHLQEFARVARNARKFWEKRRERLLVTDPLREENAAGSATLDPALIDRYEQRIANTVRQEVAVRRIMMNTLAYLNRFDQAVAEADRILELDPAQDDVLIMRASAHAYMRNYRLALRDLRAYRKKQNLSQLTDDLVRLNRRIREYEAELAKQERSGGS